MRDVYENLVNADVIDPTQVVRTPLRNAASVAGLLITTEAAVSELPADDNVTASGVIFRLIWRAFGPLAAFVVSAILFGAGHIFYLGATLLAAVSVALEAGVMLDASTL